MRLVITGGAGFLGSHLCDHFLAKGCEVICIDNLLTGSKRNIEHLTGNSSFRFILHDVTEFVKIDDPVTHILHFASPASPKDYAKYPIQTLKVGSLGTHNALGLAKAKKARFLLASTSEVYGDPLVHPQPESYVGNVDPICYRGAYDEAKRFAEAITMAYHRTHGVETRIARIFNTYGSRMRLDDGRVIPNFITQALKNEPITVYGGDQTRSFCYVTDLIAGIEKLLLSDESYPVNLGNPEELPIFHLAEKIVEKTRSQSKLTYQFLPANDPLLRQPDITKAKNLLGWQPRISLDEGLDLTIPYFRG